MDIVFKNIDAKRTSLTDQVTGLENDILRLSYENEELQKALEKQKTFHQNYADEVEKIENSWFQRW